MSDVHVRVRVGGEDYALPVESVLEVAELGDVTPVPGSPDGVIGVRNLRGQVLPVVDLAAVFGLERNGDPSRIVIAEESGRRAGLAVDELVGVEPLPDTGEEVTSPHLAGAALVNGALVGVVRVASVLDALQTEAPA